MRARTALYATVVAMLVAGCGGAGTGSPSPALPPVTGGMHNASVKFSFRIPPKTQSAQLRPNTISPSTQSIGVRVNSGAQQVFDALPTSPGCSAGSNGTTCTVTIDAPAGTDSFAVNTYSGTGATGAILDSTTLTAAILADATNTITITLGPVVSTTADSGPGSLRQAIADANPGDTVTFIIPVPSTITLTGGQITIGKNISVSGPVSGTITVSANNASRIFSIAAAATVAISNLTLTAGAVSGANGAAIDDSGALTLSSMQITNSTASGASAYGGAVAVENNGTLAVTGSTFSGDSAYQGGAMWASATGTALVAVGSTFSNNSVTSAGGYGNGGALYTSRAAALTNDTFSGNSGSAIVACAPLTVSGGTFDGNSASGGYGGAMYLEDIATISNAKFTNNTAGDATSLFGYGGALYSNYDVTVDGSTFTGNAAGAIANAAAYGYGGAIRLDDGNLTVTNSTFTSNSAGGTNAQYGYGGAISDETYNTVVITGSTFTSNQAGGLRYGYGGAIDIQATYTIDRDSFSQNAAFGSSDGAAYGGAANVGGSGSQLTNSGFSSNTATGGSLTSGSYGNAYGGGLYLTGSSTVTLDGDTFTGNTAAGADFSSGGGMDAQTATSMSGGTFSGNTAAVGVSSCSPRSEGGGASFSSDATLTNVSVTGNRATISATTGTSLCLTLKPRHAHNAARARPAARLHPKLGSFGSTEYGIGGGIECTGGNFTFSGSVTNNTAATDGGGMSLECLGTAVITNAVIDSNTVTASPGTSDGGGGLYVGTSGTTTITGSTFSNNSVAGDPTGSDGGGAIYVCTAPLSMTNDTLTGNSAQFGGNIFDEGTTALTNVTLMNGTATASGGAGGDFYGSSGDTLTIFGSIVAGGSAPAQNNLGGDGSTTIADNGYNVINTANGSLSWQTAASDTIGTAVDPQLLSLAANGGPTKTMADQSGSPGMDYIPLATCQSNGVTTDQRGNARGDASDAKCDAGAYEYP